MAEQKNQQTPRLENGRKPVSGCDNGLDRGVQSLVAEDSPDDFQIGADRKQTRDDAP